MILDNNVIFCNNCFQEGNMKYRKSKLQKEILEILKDHKVKTQAEISKILGANPSSISRSIKKLVERGLIRKESGGYIKKGASIEELTIRSSGGVNLERHSPITIDKHNPRMHNSTFDEYNRKSIEGVINRLNITIPRPIQQLEDMANRLHNVLTPLSNIAGFINTIDIAQLDEIKRAVEGIEESKRLSGLSTIENMKTDIGLDKLAEIEMNLGDSIQKELDEINKSTIEQAKMALISSLGDFDEIKSSLEEIRKTLANPQLTNQYKSIAEIAGIGASALSQIIQTENAFDTLQAVGNDFRLSLERTFGNYQHGLESILNTDLNAMIGMEFPPLLSDKLIESMKETSLRMGELISNSLQGNIQDLIPVMPEISTRLELSSLTYRDMGFSYHNLILPSDDEYAEQEIDDEYEVVKDKTEFRALLMNLDPDSNYVAMWEGAWITVNTSNPDKVRQSIHSMRTMFDCILRDYAPDAKARQYNHITIGEIITRKHRLKYIMRDAPKDEIELVESCAKAFILQLDYLHKVSHTKELTNHLPVKYVLRLCEDLIYLVAQWINRWN